jgi:hypothetical protein
MIALFCILFVCMRVQFPYFAGAYFIIGLWVAQ